MPYKLLLHVLPPSGLRITGQVGHTPTVRARKLRQGRPTVPAGWGWTGGLESRTQLAVGRVEAVCQRPAGSRGGRGSRAQHLPHWKGVIRAEGLRVPRVLTPRDPVTRIILTHSAHTSQVRMSSQGGTVQPSGTTRAQLSPRPARFHGVARGPLVLWPQLEMIHIEPSLKWKLMGINAAVATSDVNLHVERVPLSLFPALIFTWQGLESNFLFPLRAAKGLGELEAWVGVNSAQIPN